MTWEAVIGEQPMDVPFTICRDCGAAYGIGDYPFCKGGHGRARVAVVDDTVIGGRICDTIGEPFFYTSKSELRREAERRGYTNVVRREDAYYTTQRKRHDEKLRDTGNPYPDTERKPASGPMQG